MLENKIQLSTFEDQVNFIQQFMNQAASRLANRQEGPCTKWMVFKGLKGMGQEVINN